MTTATVVDTLNSLLRGELAATETYQQALAKVGEEPGAAELRRLHREHREAANTLREHINQFGGAPDTSSGAWGTFAQAVEGTAKVFGNTAALKALKEGEEHGLKSYEDALEDEDLPLECQTLIRGTLLPQTREHITALDRIMECSDRSDRLGSCPGPPELGAGGPFYVSSQSGENHVIQVLARELAVGRSEVVSGARPLAEDLHVDVCVVGAGIAGLSTAYFLAGDGRRVAVLDAGPVGGGETRYTTAHLACALDDRFCEIERIHDETAARLAAESHLAAIDRIEAVVRAENIDCDFERLDGYLFEPSGDEKSDLLRRELDAARRAGLEVVMLERVPWPDFLTGPCLRFARQGQYHPLKYLAGLARAIQRRGGLIHPHTRVEEIHGGDRAEVRTQAGPRVTANHVVVATNTPINNVVAIHTKQAPYMTYAFAAAVPRSSIPHALYWDTLDPYHYVRLQSGSAAVDALGEERAQTQEVLIVGGEDHKTGQADDQPQRYQRLEAWARERFPNMDEVLHCWSGQVMETLDGLAFIGRNPGDDDNVFIATGDSGMGMTHGTIAGMLLADLILGRPNPWAELYDPSRKPLRTALEYARENLNVAVQYGDWLTGGDVSDPADIAPGKGAVLRRGLSKVAIYRDERGVLHERSAVCTHLGCLVHWNDAEKSWDCPCHGSRFSAEGQVVHGPAASDLAPVESVVRNP